MHFSKLIIISIVFKVFYEISIKKQQKLQDLKVRLNYYMIFVLFFFSSTGLNSNKKNYESEFLPACRFTMCLVLRTPLIFSEATKAMHKITNTKILFIVRNTNFPVLIQGWGLLVCVIRPRLHSPLYTTARLL